MRPNFQNLMQVVSSIPRGSVASYGAVGQALEEPTTGRIVGRWMSSCHEEVPWWRVVNKRGELPIGKRSPELEQLQVQRLEEEGVEIVEGCIDMDKYAFYP